MKLPNQMLVFRISFLCIALSQHAFPDLASAQSITTVLLNRNASFENGTTGWSGSSTSATALTRDWTPGQFDGSGVVDFTVAFFKGEQANLGANLIEISGSGTYGQNVVVNPARGKHILNAFASKRSTSSGVAPGYASIGITYYDFAGVEVDHYEFPVAEPDANLQRGIGDGLNFYTWGINVPATAFSAYIFGYTSEGTTLQLDNLAVFEITNTRIGKLAVNLVANPDFISVRETSDPTAPTCVGYGVEFWENHLDWTTPFYDGLGSPNQAEWVYQFVPLKAGATYSVLNFGSKAPEAVASFGFDLYDKDWKPIGKRMFDLTGKSVPAEHAFRFEVPANCAHASLVLWAAARSESVQSTSILPLVYEQEPKATAASTVIATDFSPSFSRTGQVGVNVELIYSDRSGIDLSTLDISDVLFTSKTDGTKRYPASLIGVTSHDRDRLVRVVYSFRSENPFDPAFTDIDGVQIRAQRVKDKLGNWVPAKTIRPILSP